MAVSGRQVTVGATATRLDSVDRDLVEGSDIVVQNKGAASVWLGDSTVTTTTGYELAAGAVSPVITLDNSEELYAVSALSETVHVLETGV